MSDAADRRREAVIRSVLTSPGHSSPEARRAAFDCTNVDPRARALIDKVARNAWKVTDDDVAAARAAGLSDDELFELTVAASLGQASRQRDSALDALKAAMATHRRDE